MVIVFALLAALSNAVNEATQHIASTAAPTRSSGWRLVVYLFRNPLWLFGWVALAAAGFAVMCAGVVVLTQTAPATMKADIPRDEHGGKRDDAAGGAGR